MALPTCPSRATLCVVDSVHALAVVLVLTAFPAAWQAAISALLLILSRLGCRRELLAATGRCRLLELDARGRWRGLGDDGRILPVALAGSPLVMAGRVVLPLRLEGSRFTLVLDPHNTPPATLRRLTVRLLHAPSAQATAS